MRLLTCREASHILSMREDEPLGLKERLALRAHLFVCKACRRVARQFSSIRLAMQKLRDQD